MRVLATDHLPFAGLLHNKFKLLAQQFQFPEDAGSDPRTDFPIDYILQSTLEVDLLLNQQFEEVAIEEQSIRIMEVMIDPIEIDDLGELLIIHANINIGMSIQHAITYDIAIGQHNRQQMIDGNIENHCVWPSQSLRISLYIYSNLSSTIDRYDVTDLSWLMRLNSFNCENIRLKHYNFFIVSSPFDYLFQYFVKESKQDQSIRHDGDDWRKGVNCEDEVEEWFELLKQSEVDLMGFNDFYILYSITDIFLWKGLLIWFWLFVSIYRKGDAFQMLLEYMLPTCFIINLVLMIKNNLQITINPL